MKSKNEAIAMKKLIALFLSLLLAAAVMIPASAAAHAAQSIGVHVDLTDATVFEFSDDGVTVTQEGSGKYKIEGTALTVQQAGVYVLSGNCADGAVTVKKNVTGVTLVLNGLTLTSATTAPITCNKGSGVTTFAADGTINTLTDSAYNNDDLYPENEDAENAVIKCKDGSNVTISGTGTINVIANGKNGIKGGYDLYAEDEAGNATDTLLSTASLTVSDVTLNITAKVNDGLKSDKELNLRSGTITVSAADDGIKSDYVLNIGAEGTDGPTITVTESVEGIEAATLNVYSGSITVNASDDGINAANSDLTGYSFSYNQYGGTVWVNVTNGDGVDSNGIIVLAGGTLEVYSPAQGDGDPLDADGGIQLTGATVLAVGHQAMSQAITKAETAYVTFGGSNGGGFGGFGGGFGSSGTTLVSAGQTITITDGSGNTLYTAKAVRNASYVLFASPALTANSSYTLNANGSKAATATAGTSTQSGGMGHGGQPGDQPGGHHSGQPGNQPGGSETDPTQPGEEGGSVFSGLLRFLQRAVTWIRNLPLVQWILQRFQLA